MSRSLFLTPSLTVSTLRPSLCRPGGTVMAGLPAQRVVQLFLPLADLLRCAGSVLLSGGSLAKGLASRLSLQEMHQGGVGRDQARRGAVASRLAAARRGARASLCHFVIQSKKYAGTVNPGRSEVTGNRMGVFPCAR